MEPAFLDDVVGRLEKSGVTYAITGSVAGNYWGVPRMTHDVDVLVLLAIDQVAKIVEAFADAFYISPEATRSAIQHGGMVNALASTSNLKVDLWVATTNDPFSQSMLQRRR